MTASTSIPGHGRLTTILFSVGAIMSQPVFHRIGAAGGCVVGNLITAVGITFCILIATIPDPTEGGFAGFATFLYLIFQSTVLSQLSTGPMLDMLSPEDRRGFVEGLNVTAMNFARAVAPFLLGTFADEVSTEACMWTESVFLRLW